MLFKDIPQATRGTIIDVRTAEEFMLGHCGNAINVPWDLHMYYLKELEHNPKPWIFVCESGWRSGLVIHSLKAMGYKDMYNIGSWFELMREQNETEPIP